MNVPAVMREKANRRAPKQNSSAGVTFDPSSGTLDSGKGLPGSTPLSTFPAGMTVPVLRGGGKVNRSAPLSLCRL